MSVPRPLTSKIRTRSGVRQAGGRGVRRGSGAVNFTPESRGRAAWAGVLKKSQRCWIRARVLEKSNHRDIIVMVPREAGCRVHGRMPLGVGGLLQRRNSTSPAWRSRMRVQAGDPRIADSIVRAFQATIIVFSWRGLCLRLRCARSAIQEGAGYVWDGHPRLGKTVS